MDDLQIIDLYFERNETAIRETELRYGKLCMRIARSILDNEADAEECVNDTWLGVWNTIPPKRPDNLAAYIIRITRNLSLKRVRLNTAQKRTAGVETSLSELEEVLADDRRQPDMGEEQLGLLISEFLRMQSADARNVFIRKYWFFDSTAEIAGRYSFSESKVRSMLYHTRNRLRDYLKKEGVYL